MSSEIRRSDGRDPESGRKAFWRRHMGAFTHEDNGACHYMYEKAGTYRKFHENVASCMSLIMHELSKSVRERRRKKAGVNFEG